MHTALQMGTCSDLTLENFCLHMLVQSSNLLPTGTQNYHATCPVLTMADESLRLEVEPKHCRHVERGASLNVLDVRVSP